MKKIDEKNVEYLFQWSEAVHNDTYNMAINPDLHMVSAHGII